MAANFFVPYYSIWGCFGNLSQKELGGRRAGWPPLFWRTSLSSPPPAFWVPWRIVSVGARWRSGSPQHVWIFLRARDWNDKRADVGSSAGHAASVLCRRQGCSKNPSSLVPLRALPDRGSRERSRPACLHLFARFWGAGSWRRLATSRLGSRGVSLSVRILARGCLVVLVFAEHLGT